MLERLGQRNSNNIRPWHDLISKFRVVGSEESHIIRKWILLGSLAVDGDSLDAARVWDKEDA